MSEQPHERMHALSVEWLTRAAEFGHLFQNRWLGERFFHLPGDMLALQELIWQHKPARIVQTGVAAGGGVVFSASMLELLGADGKVVAIEPNLRQSVRERLATHPLARRMLLIEGPSNAPDVLRAVHAELGTDVPVMVILDLNPTHAHVLEELRQYAGLVSPGSYCIVMDTMIEYLPAALFTGRPYGPGNSPASAVATFLGEDARFAVDRDIENHVLMTLCPGGFLRRER